MGLNSPAVPSARRRGRSPWLAGLVAATALAGLTAPPLVRVNSASPATNGAERRFRPAVPYDFTADSRGCKLITRTAGARTEVERLGATLVADYDSFQVYNTSRSDVTPFSKLDGVEIAHDFNIVHLNTPINTTSRGAQELSRQRLRGGGKHLHVVQFAGPTRREWLTELLRTGVEIVNHLPHNAYLVYGDAASIERVARLGEGGRAAADTLTSTSFKQWDGPYLGAFKLDPATADAPARGKARYAVQLVADPA